MSRHIAWIALLTVTVAGIGVLLAGCGKSTGEETAMLSATVSGNGEQVGVSSAPPVDPAGNTPAAALSANTATLAAVGQVDTTPPSITAPPDIKTARRSGRLDLGTPQVSDDVDPAPEVTNDAPARFPSGTTIVTWTARDAAGNVATATQTVEIETRAPLPGGPPH